MRVSRMVFRLQRRRLSIDEVWWERVERLDVCGGGGGSGYRERCRWRGMALVVDLGIPCTLSEQYLIQTNCMYLYGPWCVLYVMSKLAMLRQI